MQFLLSHVALSRHHRLESRAPRVAVPLPVVCGQPQFLHREPSHVPGEEQVSVQRWVPQVGSA